MFQELIKQGIQRVDRNIHPRRVNEVFSFYHKVTSTLSLLFISVLIGVAGFMLIENFDFLDALYMTIITISTVGYMEVHPLSNAGRIFTIFLIVTNIGVFAYAVTTSATYIVNGTFRKIVSDILVGRKIDKMRNHIIVCGYGRYGQSVIENILAQNLECVVIEMDASKVEDVRSEKKAIVLEGDSTNEGILIEAGIKNARAIITTLPVDSDNVYTILTARQLNPNVKIISRANKASTKPKMIRAGADDVLIPEDIGGFYMSALITKPDIINVFQQISGPETSQFRMAETILDSLPTHLKGKTLGDLKLEEKAGVKIIGVKAPNGQYTVNPPMDMPLEQGEGILVIGDKEQIGKFHLLTHEFEFIE